MRPPRCCSKCVNCSPASRSKPLCPLEHFLKAIRLGVEWAIEHRAVFDLLCHPAVLYPNDPEFKVIELVCGLVQQSHGRAALADLDALAQRAK